MNHDRKPFFRLKYLLYVCSKKNLLYKTYYASIIVTMNNNEKTNEASNEATTTISEEMFEQAKNELCKIITTNDEQLVREFCECIFTPAEIKDLVNRWLLVKEIDKGTTQREIARKFGMSLCKITRGSKELSKPDSAFRKVLDTLK